MIMPTFYLRDINIRLSVADLEQTITTAPVNTLCKTSTDNADRAAEQFESDGPSGTLAETPLWPDDNGCRLRFLGDQQDVPFIMVHAQPKYPFGTATTNASPADKKPPPLQLVTSIGNGEIIGSPLSDLSSPPMSPTLALPNSESRTSQSISNGPIHSSQRRASIHNLDGAKGESNVLITEPKAPTPRSPAGLPIAPALIDDQLGSLRQLESLFPQQKPTSYRELGPQHPQALCLRVLPSAKSFLRTLDQEGLRLDVNDIKIDVYLNGDLCASTYVQERIFLRRGHARTFSGARTHRLREVPWILKPPLNADVSGDGQSDATQTTEDARNRWTNISDGLKLAAEANGRNKHNELPAVGQYLQKLAAVPMPATVPNMLKTSRSRFAVIDVVVTTGKGNKDDASGAYQFGLLPLKLHGYGLHVQSSPLNYNSEGPRKVQKDGSSRTKRSFADEKIAAQSFPLHNVPRNSVGELLVELGSDEENDTNLSKDPSITQAYHETKPMNLSEADSTHTPSASGAHQPYTPIGLLSLPPRRISTIRKTPVSYKTPQPKKVPSTIPFITKEPTEERPVPVAAPVRGIRRTSATPTTWDRRPSKKKKTLYYDVLDTRQTAAEEMEDIARQAADRDAIYFTKRRVTRSKLADTPDAIDALALSQSQLASDSVTPTPVTSAPETNIQNALARPARPTTLPDLVKRTVEKGPPPLRLKYRRSAPVTPVDGPDTSSPEKPLILHHHTASFVPQTPREPSTSQPREMSVPPAKVFSSKKTPVQRDTFTPWEKPSSRDSIVTYAEGGMERQIRAERVGCFAEERVLVGVRFVVG
ncbi:MAG: hypothetical protein Q9177_001461 [Variospora cf. flavescens]